MLVYLDRSMQVSVSGAPSLRTCFVKRDGVVRGRLFWGASHTCRWAAFWIERKGGNEGDLKDLFNWIVPEKISTQSSARVKQHPHFCRVLFLVYFPSACQSYWFIFFCSVYIRLWVPSRVPGVRETLLAYNLSLDR